VRTSYFWIVLIVLCVHVLSLLRWRYTTSVLRAPDIYYYIDAMSSVDGYNTASYIQRAGALDRRHAGGDGYAPALGGISEINFSGRQVSITVSAALRVFTVVCKFRGAICMAIKRSLCSYQERPRFFKYLTIGTWYTAHTTKCLPVFHWVMIADHRERPSGLKHISGRVRHSWKTSEWSTRPNRVTMPDCRYMYIDCLTAHQHEEAFSVNKYE